MGDRSFAEREEWRHVIHTVGESLRECESALHLLKTIYDALQGTFFSTDYALFTSSQCASGHQALLMQTKILHRDVSFGNILTKPVHQGTKVDFTARPNTIPYVPIDALLEGIKECV